MTCPHATHLCLISTELAGVPVPIAEDACKHCNLQPIPQTVNNVTLSKAIYHASEPQRTLLANRLGRTKHPEAFEGVGTQLKQIINWFVWSAQPESCKICKTREVQMNRWGPDGCEHHLPEILAWLKESAKLAGYPYSEFLVKIAVKKAIRNERKKINSNI